MVRTSDFQSGNESSILSGDAIIKIMNNLYQLEVITKRLNTIKSYPLTRHELRISSQNGEDGIILEMVRRIFGSDYKNKNFFEFGVEDGKECNCAILANFLDWDGVFIESDKEKFKKLDARYKNNNKIKTLNRMVDSKNIQDIINKNMPEIDILSIDIDSHDYWVWEAIETKPKIVIIEYNGQLSGKKVLSKERTSGWDGTTAYGASLDAYIDLGIKKGYSLVYTDLNGVNAFFIRNDYINLFPETTNPQKITNKVHHPITTEDVFIDLE